MSQNQNRKRILEILRSLFSNDDNIRQRGENVLKSASMNQGYVTFMMGIVNDLSVDFHLRLMGCVVLKNFIVDHYDELPFKNDKIELKKLILIAYRTVSKQRILKTLNIIMNKLVFDAFPQNWPEVVPTIMAYFQSNDLTKIGGALNMLAAVYDRYKFDCDQTETQRGEIRRMVNNFTPTIVKLYKYVSGLKPTKELACIRYVCAKVFYKAINNTGGTPEFLLNNVKLFDDFMVNVLLKELQSFRGESFLEGWKAKKWITHLVQRIFNMYGLPKMRQKLQREEELGKYFQRTYVGKFLEVFLQIIEEKKKKHPQITNDLVALSIRFFQSSFLYDDDHNMGIFKQIKSQLSKIFNILLPYLIFTEDDKLLAQNNPSLFSRINYETGETYLEREPRVVVGSTFNILCYHDPKLIPVVLQYVSSIMKNPEVPMNVKDGALSIFGILGAILLCCQDQTLLNGVEAFFLSTIAPLISSNLWFIRARVIWICGEYGGFKFRNSSSIGAIVTHILKNLENQNLIVREQAGIAFCSYLQYEIVVQEARKHLGIIFKCFIELINKHPTEDFLYALEVIFSSFKKEVLPYALNLLQHLVVCFMKVYENYCKDKEGDMCAFSLLKAIGTLCNVTKDSSTLKKFEPILLPLYQKLLTVDDFEFLEHVIQIITHHVYSMDGPYSQNFWKMYVRLHQIYSTEGVEMTSYFMPIFDNFISNDTPTYLANPVFVELSVKWCETLLARLEKATSIEKNVSNGAELLSCILQHTKGNKMIEMKYFPRIVFAVVKRLSAGTKTDSLSILLVNSICDALFFNCEHTVSLLMSKNCFQPIIKIWWELVPKFYRNFERKMTILGLASLIQCSFNSNFNFGSNFVCRAASLALKCIQQNQEKDEEGKKKGKVRNMVEQKIFDYEGSNSNSREVIKRSERFKEVISEIHMVKMKEDLEKVDILITDDDFNSPILEVDEVKFFKDSLKRLQRENLNVFKQLFQNCSQGERNFLMN